MVMGHLVLDAWLGCWVATHLVERFFGAGPACLGRGGAIRGLDSGGGFADVEVERRTEGVHGVSTFPEVILLRGI